MDEPYTSVSATGGYTNIVGGRGLDQSTGTVATRFGPDKRAGILIGGSYDWNSRGINRSTTMGRRGCTPPGVGDFLTPTTTADNGSVSYRNYDRQVNQQIFSVDGGAKHVVRAMLVDYDVSVSAQHGNFPTANFDGPDNVAFGMDLSDPYRPKFPVLNGLNIYDLTRSIPQDGRSRAEGPENDRSDWFQQTPVGA